MEHAITDIIESVKTIKELRKEIVELKTLVKYYEEQYKLLQQKKSGKSSEKTDPRQRELFDEAENEADLRNPEPTIGQITYTRMKRTGKREED
jgi:hypothetical protein